MLCLITITMSNKNKFIFTLVFTYDKVTLKFKYKIAKEDYETFYFIISDFFTMELEEEQLTLVYNSYPDFKDRNVHIACNLKNIFERDFCVDGIQKINDYEYKISWST